MVDPTHYEIPRAKVIKGGNMYINMALLCVFCGVIIVMHVLFACIRRVLSAETSTIDAS